MEQVRIQAKEYQSAHSKTEAQTRVRAGQGKSWKTGISGKALMVNGKSGIVRKIDKSQGKLRK